VRDVVDPPVQRGRCVCADAASSSPTPSSSSASTNGTLTLMDEVLTPDSSRFWPVAGVVPRRQNPPSYDKQFVRDWLDPTIKPSPERHLSLQRRTTYRISLSFQDRGTKAPA
jgi:hypothetical protein